MTSLKKLFLLTLTAAGLLCTLTGCTTKTQQDSTIPWSRPASWEGGIPGMGGLGGPR